MEVEKVIHKGFDEWASLPSEKKKLIPNFFGRYQYLYKTKKGEIDLIFLRNMAYNIEMWEIYSKDTLFKGVERFKTKKEAEKRIRELLE